MDEGVTEPGSPGEDPSGEAAERLGGPGAEGTGAPAGESTGPQAPESAGPQAPESAGPQAAESTGPQAPESAGPQAAASAGEQTGRPASQAELLAELNSLRREARAGRHAYWFPLVLFGLLTCASVPFYIRPLAPAGTVAFSHAPPGPPLPLLGGFPGITVQRYLAYYWLAALAMGLLATLAWYRRHAQRVGLQTPARGYVITGLVLTVLAVVVPLISQPGGLGWLRLLWPGDLVLRGTFPFLIIAAGLWVLARAERSVALTVIAAVYTGTGLLASLYNVENILFRLGWNPAPGQWDLTSLPNVLLPALVLLGAGAGAFAVQRRHRRTA